MSQSAPPTNPGLSVYCVLVAGRWRGLKFVEDGLGIRETLDDEPSIVIPLPAHLAQEQMTFEEESCGKVAPA